MPGRQISPTSLRLIVAIMLSALILCWPAYLNGFPLVFGDTGNYIGQAILHYIGWNAPPFYSIFLLATDWRLTLWPPILVQGLMAASLVSIVLHQFGLRGPWPTLSACIGLSIFTSLPWVASELMADVYTGIVVLSLTMLAFGTLALWQRLFLLLLAFFAIAVHQSHIPLAFGLLLVGCAVRWWQDGRGAALLAFRRLAPAPVLATILVFSVNLLGLGQAAVSPYGSIVLAARMIGDGTAISYLHAACPTEHYKICDHLDQVGKGGSSMLWSKPDLWIEMGGTRAWAPESARIVRGTIAYSPYAFVVAALDNGMQQFAAMQTGERLEAWAKPDGPRPLIARFFPGELYAFDHSRQETGHLVQDVKPFAALHVAIAWLGLAGLLVAIITERRNNPAFGLCLMVLAAVIGNAMITGALSGVESRYAARIAWLLGFTPCLILAAHLRVRTVLASAARSGVFSR